MKTILLPECNGGYHAGLNLSLETSGEVQGRESKTARDREGRTARDREGREGGQGGASRERELQDRLLQETHTREPIRCCTATSSSISFSNVTYIINLSIGL